MSRFGKYLGRRWRGPRLVGLVAVVVCGYLATFGPLVGFGWLRSRQGLTTDDVVVIQRRDSHVHRHVRSMDDEGTAALEDEPSSDVKHRTEHSSNKSAPLFPPDLFTMSEKRHGAVCLHIMGMIYMFVALAIVCDEFFVPSLDVIIEKLGIVEDVAGATFMAAGGSAPELFTSVIGVFVSFDDVGIGTIVGSAVFNILFVIGMCSIFSHGVLQLTWWPLFRDVSFYSLSLIVLIICFLDNNIFWFEALALLFLYTCYVLFMKWNVTVEQLVKKHLYKNKVARVSSADQLVSGETGRVSHTPVIHAGSKFRHGLLHLMISSIDPMHDGSSPTGVVDEKATQNHAIASLKVLLDATKTPGTNAGTPTDSEYSKPTLSPGQDGHVQAATALESGDSGQYSQETEMSHLSGGRRKNSGGNADDAVLSTGVRESRESRIIRVGRRKSSVDLLAKRKASADAVAQNNLNHVVSGGGDGGAMTTILGNGSGDEAPLDGRSDAIVRQIEEEEGEHDALDLSWPETTRKRISYVLLAPIMFPLWLTLPDTRRQEKKKWFAITFLGSILWIAVFSYLMVWWASEAGLTFGVPNEVMGLTFLAAGTSIPDLITSVIVARKGLGDMAVSSSIGSNIFDVTVGLPFPWLIYGAVHKGKPVVVNSAGMACSIVILFAMLIFVIMTIACFKWRMNKGMGFVMFFLYFVFVAVSLLFEYSVWKCPL